MLTLYSMVNETGNRNRILEMRKLRFWLVHWIDPRSIEHSYACFKEFQTRAAAIAHYAKTFYFISDVVPCQNKTMKRSKIL